MVARTYFIVLNINRTPTLRSLGCKGIFSEKELTMEYKKTRGPGLIPSKMVKLLYEYKPDLLEGCEVNVPSSQYVEHSGEAT